MNLPPADDSDDDERSWLVDYTREAGGPPAEWFRSDEELREQIEAFNRESEPAPPYVADDLAATTEEARQARTDAEFAGIWAANGDPAPTSGWPQPTARDLEYEHQRADDLAGRVMDLHQVDEARRWWYAHTTPARETAEAANRELMRRGHPSAWGDPSSWAPLPEGRVLSREETAAALVRSLPTLQAMQAEQAAVWEPNNNRDDDGPARGR